MNTYNGNTIRITKDNLYDLRCLSKEQRQDYNLCVSILKNHGITDRNVYEQYIGWDGTEFYLG